MWALLAILALPLLWVLIDTAAGFKARKFRDARLPQGFSEDFTILVPIYGSMDYLINEAFLSQYGSRVVLCTTSGETDMFYRRLALVAGRNGFRIYQSPYAPDSTPKKRRTGGTVRDRVIRDALLNLDDMATYTICIDADVTSSRKLQRLVGALESTGADFASVDLSPQEDGGMLVQLQRHEYRQSMRMRFLLPWMLSGACHLGRTEVLREIMSRHSLFFQGNDVEAGLLGERLGYKAVHLPFSIDTEVPASLKPWWRQRVAWAGGEFRLFITNFRFIIHHPLLWIYGAVVTILLVGMRWWSLVIDPSWMLIAVAVMYYASILWIHWRTRNWWLLLLPIYILFNSLVMTIIGVLWYFVMAIPEKNFGVIRPGRKVSTAT